jgi:heme-degrading monooxygenase HmoA
MTYLLVNHKVEDYDKWKLAYDENGDMRKVKGSKGAFVFRTAEDPNHILVLTEWENLESAKNFAEDKELKTAMKKGGVVGQIDSYILEEIERTGY